MTDADSYQEHQREIEAAILAVTGSAMISHYVVVAVTVREDGEEREHRITSPGMPLWQVHGLLSFEAAGCVPQPDWTDR